MTGTTCPFADEVRDPGEQAGVRRRLRRQDAQPADASVHLTPQQQPEGADHASLTGGTTTGEHEGTAGSHCPAEVSQGAVADEVDHDVVAGAVTGEVVGSAVDDPVRPQGRGEGRVARADDCRHLQPPSLRQLDGEGADTTGRAVDQDGVARRGVGGIQAEQCGGRGERQGGRLVEAQAGGDHVELVGRDDGVVGERCRALTEDVVTHPPPGHALADGLHRAGEVGAADRDPRPAQPEAAAVQEPREARLTAHHVPVARVDRRCPHPHEHLSRARRRGGDAPQLQHLGWSVDPLHDRAGRFAADADIR